MKAGYIMYNITIWNNQIIIEGLEGVFSPKNIDTGTKTMLDQIELSTEDKVLDLGCGTGVVGIAVAKKIGGNRVVMTDIDQKAIACSKRNIELNNLSNIKLILSSGFENIKETDFTLILSNPPYHTDFSVAKEFIESGKKHLQIGGKMVLVVKRLDWYKNKLSSIFGGVKVIEENGYYVLISEKRDVKNRTKKKTKPIKKKHLKKINSSKKK
ncbi:class I SAM-dependent methyltransferase [Mycoplasmatota bacterium]|nr:class I SAM-dependent methyltransferase [Mycoplasmatota bacterium]